MARITVLPDSEAIGVVDIAGLLQGRPAPQWDQKSGQPMQMRTFVVSEDPRIVVVPHFLSEAECAHILDLAEGLFTRSLVGSFADAEEESPGAASGAYGVPAPARGGPGGIKSKQAQTRTSSSCMLRASQTAAVERIELRLASLAKLPVENLERPAVVRYAPGELFSDHHDGKFRPRTIFIYLNDLPEGDTGGDTFFPHLGLSFVPRAGCAVMWTNSTPEGVEDSRLVHCGRAPRRGVKYGVNCFFNDDRMRLVHRPELEASLQEAHNVDVRALAGGAESSGPGRAIRRYVLKSVPEITAIPCVASDEEVDHILAIAGVPQGAHAAPDRAGECAGAALQGGTELLHLLKAAETPVLEALERRLADASHFPLEHLGPARVVRSGTAQGMCNRGCGQRSGLVCLSERDEVFFPHLGLRLLLRRGDGLVWPNAWFSEPAGLGPDARPRVVEDLRTTRVHVGSEGALALDISFHDTPIRTLHAQAQSACMAAPSLSLSGG